MTFFKIRLCSLSLIKLPPEMMRPGRRFKISLKLHGNKNYTRHIVLKTFNPGTEEGCLVALD
eukprot:CAMPEP_0202909324 /NCGR_PEP_ID=MMETSP1392-20130828/49025_1 /ASSEMBLY_ACC=CAM_ASM_000868 /TAXON_ID=225041 /ORGANISM="Chlamydomonas chlamydogama, Strain SAG 11-48b" /LENGTH=61 /DNA_ID=CAMNT_0049599035 /DNA_START=57 /DNA_END=239 /DNA_ORIENTATION=+